MLLDVDQLVVVVCTIFVPKNDIPFTGEEKFFWADWSILYSLRHGDFVELELIIMEVM